MIIEEIYNKWTEFINDNKYKIYFLSNEDEWFELFNKVKLYIDTNNKRPSKHDKNLEIKQLGAWLGMQQQNYKNKEHIMVNEEIYNKWSEFINKYKIYFISNEDLWFESFNKVKKYINNNNKRPSKHDKNLEIKTLGSWIVHQSKNYKIKDRIMSNEEIYNEWTKFINDPIYKNYF